MAQRRLPGSCFRSDKANDLLTAVTRLISRQQVNVIESIQLYSGRTNRSAIRLG